MIEKEVILITGGSGKFGNILVNHFTSSGHFVFFTSRDKLKIKQIEDSFKKTNFFVKGIKVDHTESGSTEQIINELNTYERHPTVLINNVRNMDFLKLSDGNGAPSETAWFGELKLAVIIPSELSIRLSKQPESILKNIINISSIYGIVPPNLNLYQTEEDIVPIHYGVAKAAQIHLTKELAVRLSKFNIRVNSVTYGGVEGRTDGHFISRYSELCPQRRMLTEKDIPGPIEFLMSKSSSGMTGHNLIVDGGWTIW